MFLSDSVQSGWGNFTDRQVKAAVAGVNCFTGSRSEEKLIFKQSRIRPLVGMDSFPT